MILYLYLTLYSHKKTSVPLTVFREKRGAYNALKQRKLTTWGVSLIWGLRKMKFICNAIFSIWYFFSYLVIMYTWINRIVYGEKCLLTNILRKVDFSFSRYLNSFCWPIWSNCTSKLYLLPIINDNCFLICPIKLEAR